RPLQAYLTGNRSRRDVRAGGGRPSNPGRSRWSRRWERFPIAPELESKAASALSERRGHTTRESELAHRVLWRGKSVAEWTAVGRGPGWPRPARAPSGLGVQSTLRAGPSLGLRGMTPGHKLEATAGKRADS